MTSRQTSHAGAASVATPNGKVAPTPTTGAASPPRQQATATGPHRGRALSPVATANRKKNTQHPHPHHAHQRQCAAATTGWRPRMTQRRRASASDTTPPADQRTVNDAVGTWLPLVVHVLHAGPCAAWAPPRSGKGMTARRGGERGEAQQQARRVAGTVPARQRRHTARRQRLQTAARHRPFPISDDNVDAGMNRVTGVEWTLQAGLVRILAVQSVEDQADGEPNSTT